jgi:plasmid replication initiation protein
MINKNNLVEKSRNMVAMQCFSMGLQELKILDVYLSKIDPRDKNTRAVVFKKTEYEQLLGLEKIDAKRLEEYVTHLMRNIINIPLSDKKFRKHVLFPNATFEKINGEWTIALEINPQLDEVFFNIENLGYIRYRLQYTVKLQSKYDIKLYLFFKLHEYNKPCAFNIQLSELKEKIECTQKSYNKYFLFNQKVLAPSVQRINSFTDINVEYKKPYGEDYIEFIVRKKTKEELQKQDELEQLEQKTPEELQSTEEHQLTEEPVKESVGLDNKYNLPLDVLQDEDYDLDLLETKVRQAIPSADENKMQEIFQVVNIKYNPKNAKAPFLYYLGILKKTLLERTELGKQDKIEQAKKNKFHNFDQRDYDYDALLHELNGLG